jgi:hypothetical protein
MSHLPAMEIEKKIANILIKFDRQVIESFGLNLLTVFQLFTTKFGKFPGNPYRSIKV